MQRLHSSAALVVSVIALFVALGGSALAISQIGTAQIQDGAVTTSKLHSKAVTTGKLANNAVTTSRLANNSVTGAQVKDGSLTASDVAPNTFLAANGTAANSQLLGGLPAGGFVQGSGSLSSKRVVVPVGQTASLLSLGLGSLSGTCPANGMIGNATVGWTPTLANENYSATVVTFGAGGATTTLDTLNAIPAGGTNTEPNPNGVPQEITYQISYTDGNGASHVTTAWTVGRFLFGTGCLFSAQGVTTG